MFFQSFVGSFIILLDNEIPKNTKRQTFAVVRLIKCSELVNELMSTSTQATVATQSASIHCNTLKVHVDGNWTELVRFLLKQLDCLLSILLCGEILFNPWPLDYFLIKIMSS